MSTRVLYLLIVITYVALGASAQTALVHIHVNTAYDDSDRSINFIQRLIRDLPPHRELILPGESLSGFILRIYRVSHYNPRSPSYLPKTYELLEGSIMSLNKIDSPTKARAGLLFVPQVPKKALAQFNPRLPQNSVPHLMLFDNITKRNGSLAESSADRFVITPAEDAPVQQVTATQTADIELPLTTALSRELLTDPILSGNSSALSFPLRARLAGPQQPSGTDHIVLKDNDHTQISTLLASKAMRSVPVFILDTGWPDPGTYTNSRALIKSIIASVWTKQLSGAGPVPSINAQPFVPPRNSHCTVVQRSLNEFEQMDPDHKVQVIYVPLTREQDSSNLLVLILQTSLLLQYLKEHPGAPIQQAIVKATKQDAMSIVASLQPFWDGGEVNTDKAIMDAVLRIGEAWGSINQSGFVVNESWTVDHEQYFVYYASPPPGIVVSAVGNTGENINVVETDFAERCSSSIDTLAVMNWRPGAGDLLCCSSHIDESGIAGPLPATAASFDGEVSGTGCDQECGTSFAAPRVAWIIAAGDVLRSSPFTTFNWGLNVKSRLLSSRQPNVTGWAATWLDPVKYLSIQQ